MAVMRVPLKCPSCGEPYKAIYKKSDLSKSMQIIGDIFLQWDIEGHQKICKKTHCPICKKETKDCDCNKVFGKKLRGRW